MNSEVAQKYQEVNNKFNIQLPCDFEPNVGIIVNLETQLNNFLNQNTNYKIPSASESAILLHQMNNDKKFMKIEANLNFEE